MQINQFAYYGGPFGLKYVTSFLAFQVLINISKLIELFKCTFTLLLKYFDVDVSDVSGRYSLYWVHGHQPVRMPLFEYAKFQRHAWE